MATTNEEALRKELARVTDVAEQLLSTLNLIVGVGNLSDELLKEVAAAKKAANAAGIRLTTTK